MAAAKNRRHYDACCVGLCGIDHYVLSAQTIAHNVFAVHEVPEPTIRAAQGFPGPSEAIPGPACRASRAEPGAA